MSCVLFVFAFVFLFVFVFVKWPRVTWQQTVCGEAPGNSNNHINKLARHPTMASFKVSSTEYCSNIADCNNRLFNTIWITLQHIFGQSVHKIAFSAFQAQKYEFEILLTFVTSCDWCRNNWLEAQAGNEFHFCRVFCNSAVLPMINTQSSNCVWVFNWRAVHKWRGLSQLWSFPTLPILQ